MLMEKDLQPYVERKLLNKSQKGDLTLYCYSKETFFSKDWDDVTKACRGLVFRDGKQINHPFPKIFNLDETPDTSADKVFDLIESNENHVLMHKVNGHLTIVDYIPELNQWIVHTKGSLQDNEMNEYDRNLFHTKCARIKERVEHLRKYRYTFLFESVNPTDQHTLYDQEVKRYGRDELVLLGIYATTGVDDNDWLYFPPHAVKAWARFANIPYAQMIEDPEITPESIKSMFSEKDTEGYVIWFHNLDFRVKIKTTDYWKMRFRKDLSADMIIDRFVAGGDDRLFNRYPEEVADKVVELIEQYYSLFITKEYIFKIPKSALNLPRKEIGLSDDYCKIQKSIIFRMMDGKDITCGSMMGNKQLRVAFKGYMDYNSNHKEAIKQSLIDYIEKREETI